jgi:hypothetical protein
MSCCKQLLNSSYSLVVEPILARKRCVLPVFGGRPLSRGVVELNQVQIQTVIVELRNYELARSLLGGTET